MKLAARMVLGLELKHLKRNLGYEGEGSWQLFHKTNGHAARPTWNQYCRNEAGISDTMARKYFQCSEVLRMRIRMRRRKGWKKILKLMKRQPSQLPESERFDLVRLFLRFGMGQGDTVAGLLEEYAVLNTDETDRRIISPDPDEENADYERTAEQMWSVIYSRVMRVKLTKLYLDRIKNDKA
ncbi:MAG: hypothetical protein EOP85_19555 [Verrucomicrobiaceae bacterium]|nr:MAG: hypothetical protein EOP85_19555 [Verrucomicrobiaceae bacterium]